MIRPCGTAQLQIENEIRLVGPGDPQSRAKLTVIGKIGARTEKIELPYAGGWREDERPAAMGQMGAALSEVMFKLDPTYKQRAQEYFRKHPEEVPKR
ncbi:MAG: hypothetical protein LAP61_05395 [Acidobacteriia bacterium]|nr:hypothetical protein [Terriglobia bacterium]